MGKRAGVALMRRRTLEASPITAVSVIIVRLVVVSVSGLHVGSVLLCLSGLGAVFEEVFRQQRLLSSEASRNTLCPS